ncbi:MAG: nucleoside deaminase [Candidatus Omnitrophica bacterium]|nr:nucleoside deaminase [Candidatus Omnitrophota bacterium]
MQLAIDRARKGVALNQTPFGACIVKEDEIISCAHNLVWSGVDITAHAEIQAIRQACQRLGGIDLSGCDIYSTCEPCPMCFSACHWAKIKKIYYGANIADAQEAGFNELAISNELMKDRGDSPVEVVGGCLREECRSLFKEWAQKGHRNVY